LAAAAGVPAQVIGQTITDKQLKLGENEAISLHALRLAHEHWLPQFMGDETT
jgi:hypothetical protein